MQVMDAGRAAVSSAGGNAAPSALTRAARRLRCMEIWGGNTDLEEHLELPGVEAWIHAAACDAAGGGDVHYISTCGSGSIVRFAVADVAGHGARVADLGARLRALMRKYINTLDQTRFAREINGELAASSREGRFATALLTTLHVPTRRLLVCNAGHPRPLRFRRAAATWDLLDSTAERSGSDAGNLPFGIAGPTPYSQLALHLELGDVLILYTDALIDTPCADGGRLGERGLLALAARIDARSAPVLGRRLLDEIDALRGPTAPQDDRTLIVLRLLDDTPRPPSTLERARVLAKMMRLLPV